MTQQRLVFIGDSITEWGRFEDPLDLGDNYVRIIRDLLAIESPEMFPEIINKGIGGNRISDLAERWQEDVIALNPDWLSISIGINDVWRQLDNPDMEQIYPDQFERIYDQLLKEVKNQTDATIILMEPTIIEEEIHSRGNELLKAYLEATHRLAEKYACILVPTHKAFLDVLATGLDVPLTIDGVHMSSTGNQLMAKTWLETVTLFK
ncbi:lysophospholipase L1-like esterase [Streptohalobacillus salinus]|uniref:Lysophospholipase L1-like esterase n=1 Tax=Streptohalobacillus salinus TaxID=621096 RepID=A0A2V3WDN5_9BACI|nr:SGNH/GDSL hydrolase family protein [Streptohalobacillus salinus]PXW93026.1 lysophospholipase L1-like esterase [Streptohalobacillus salinus]